MVDLREQGISFEHWCFACGDENPRGLHVRMYATREGAFARYTPERAHQGYDGTVHGGIVTALLDEVMAWSMFLRGGWGVTARLTVTFREPVRVGEPLLASGRIARDRGRGVETAATLVRESDARLLAEAEALFLPMPDDTQAELARRYGAEADVLARVRAAVEGEGLATNGARVSGGTAGPSESRRGRGLVRHQEQVGVCA